MSTTLRGGWFKSSFSASSNNCVEVRFSTGSALIRDSKHRRTTNGATVRQPVITIPFTAWSGFLTAATERTNRSLPGVASFTPTSTGEMTLRAPDGTALTYTAQEWDAFTAGIEAGEFSLLAAA
ncbi:DUF397 domain-containing protein [Nocardia cyriacigeorgica]|uniref:DUF397 domain-containing protein n=1 Tax=Nocardia cyriacigeorgica TaxID=135487 RepID=UPI002456EF19|nr:DUF397 domain-containing protein [Nocardia cyriacigeorgica]